MLNHRVGPDDISALIAAGESETLESKETTGTPRDATITVCAFLNQCGGQVLFGVTQDGTVAGQPISERTIEELSAGLREIDPPAFPTVERVSASGDREVIVVSTSQGPLRPYTYRGNSYRRLGNTTLAMSADEYNRMLFERMQIAMRNNAGKVRLLPDGPLMISTRRRCDEPSRKLSGAGLHRRRLDWRSDLRRLPRGDLRRFTALRPDPG